MGFTIYPKYVVMPDTLVGVYLLPFAWMKYGFHKNYLTVQDNKFYDTVQGAMYLEVQKVKSDVEFAVYNPNEPGVMYVINPSEGQRFRDEHLKFTEPFKVNVYPYNIEAIAELSPAGQKTVNNGLIQLLKGCKVKMNQTVWF